MENKGYFLYKIIESLTKRILEHLYGNSKDLKLLNRDDKKSLAYFVEMFYDDEIAEDYLREAKSIKAKKRGIWLSRLFNKNLNLINGVASGAINITSSIIRQSIGVDTEFDYNEIKVFDEISIDEIKSLSMQDVVNKGCNRLLSILKMEIDIALKLNYESIVVLFDKIDEFSDVSSDINKVADFTLPILKDTDLLYTEHLSIVFSLWSEVKRTLNNRGVRFDKFQDIDISWRDDELVKIIDKRLLYYSIDKTTPVTLESLVPIDNDRCTVLKLAGGSPRALISLMSRLYDEERCENTNGVSVDCFSSDTISRGLVEFCKRFDYESLQPSKVLERKDYFSWLNKALMMKKPYFTLQEVANEFTIKNATAQKYINDMIKLGIISPDMSNGEDDDNVFKVSDPRICYLMTRGVRTLD